MPFGLTVVVTKENQKFVGTILEFPECFIQADSIDSLLSHCLNELPDYLCDVELATRTLTIAGMPKEELAIPLETNSKIQKPDLNSAFPSYVPPHCLDKIELRKIFSELFDSELFIKEFNRLLKHDGFFCISDKTTSHETILKRVTETGFFGLKEKTDKELIFQPL